MVTVLHRNFLARRFDQLLLTAATAAIAAFISGCQTPFINKPTASPDPNNGYRFLVADAMPGNDDEVFIILAFSGGGTRAAAFSYGAMKGLSEIEYTMHGKARKLIDDVHMISSVSGGSFTAAYYGLHTKQEFLSQFPSAFLERNVERDLALRLLNPINWLKLSSPNYGRIDMAAEYFSERLFDNKTFSNIQLGSGRPFIVINATDMDFVGRFDFTQDQFDALGSDLSSFPVGRAVAASSAFPILLTPLTLFDYPKKADVQSTRWIQNGLKSKYLEPKTYANAVQNNAYFSNTTIRYIHLLDGGLADNIGLRGPAAAIDGIGMPWSMQYAINEKVRHLIVIAVNARASASKEWSKEQSPPGIGAVLSVVTGGPMDNFSADTVQEMKDDMGSLRQAAKDSAAFHDCDPKKYPFVLSAPKFIHAIELSFDDVQDADARAEMNKVATNYSLSKDQVNLLVREGKRLMNDTLMSSGILSDLDNDLAK